MVIGGEGGAIALTPLPQVHGDIISLGFRIGGLAYCPDISDFPDSTVPLLPFHLHIETSKVRTPAIGSFSPALYMQVFTCLLLGMINAEELEDRVFKALADSSRRKVLDLLAAQNGRTLTALCEALDMRRQSATQHIQILIESNLVSTVWKGREKLHFINPVPIHAVYERWVRKFEEQRLSLLHQLKQELEGE